MTMMDELLANQWTGKACELDGQPARIVGRLLPFAKIAPDNPNLSSVEYSWETVNRIMRTTQAFSR